MSNKRRITAKSLGTVTHTHTHTHTTNLKNSKGITLIVLVITIIVLLILSGVAISTISGNNGILNKAVNAKIKTEEAAEKEKIKLAYIAANKKNGITNDVLQKACEMEFGKDKTKSRVFDNGEITILVTDTGREYYIDNDDNIIMTRANDVNDIEGLSGNGSLATPFEISSIEDLILFSNNVKNGTNYAGQYVKLTRDLNFRLISSYIEYDKIVDEENNIDLMTSMIKGEGFTPIGTSSKYFKGIFDGNNKTIKNLYINRSDYAALFDTAECTIENLTLDRADITSTGSYAGGLIANGKKLVISNCNMNNLKIIGESYTGGIAATGNGSIINSLVNNIYIETKTYVVGGIIGFGNGSQITIKKCYCSGSLVCKESEWAIGGAGGIIGHFFGTNWQSNDSVTFEDCTSKVDIEATGNAGGMLGNTRNNKNINIKNCSNYGDIATNGNYVYLGIGGMVGRYQEGYLYIQNCINYGDISKTNKTGGTRVGGILGNAHGGKTINMKIAINIGSLTKSTWGGGSNSIVGATISSQSFLNCYYNNSYLTGGTSGGSTDKNTYAKLPEELKSQEFVNELNKLIGDGKTINQDIEDDPETEEVDERVVTIDTTGYAKWVYNAGDYPTLDLTTKWNATTKKWEKE